MQDPKEPQRLLGEPVRRRIVVTFREITVSINLSADLMGGSSRETAGGQILQRWLEC